MDKSPFLRGITITFGEDGEPDIPESDINRAYRDVIGKKIYAGEWD